MSSCGRVEAFAEVLAGRDDDELLPGRAVLDLLDDRGAGALAQAPFENKRRDASRAKTVGQQLAVLRPLAENEAASALVESFDHVVADERRAGVVVDEEPEHFLDRRLACPCDHEVALAHPEFEREVTGGAFAARDPVADRPALHGDDLLQAVSSVRGCGQAEEMADRCLPHVRLERDGRQVVALVDHDQAIAAEERFEVVDRP